MIFKNSNIIFKNTILKLYFFILLFNLLFICKKNNIFFNIIYIILFLVKVNIFTD